MFDRQTLRGRLTLAYASSLVLALIFFAAIALVVIDQSQRRALDIQLASIANTALALVEPADFQTTLDVTDRAQLTALAGAKVNSAILRRDGTIATSSTVAVPTLVRDRSITAQMPGYVTLAIGRDPIRLYAVPVLARGARIGTIAIWRDVETIQELDKNVAIAFAIAIPLIAGMAIVGGSAIARRGLAPLVDMAALASEIEAHDLAQRIALPPRDDELGRLAATLDRMLDRLQRAFDRERRFTSDASHEIRAPLSVIRAEADLALSHDRDGDEYRRALRAIAMESDALEALTSDLLAAARADAGAGERLARFDLGALAAEVARRFAVIARVRDVHLVERRDLATPVAADRALLERAIVAIVDNAVKYARPAGTVAIEVAIDGADVVARVSDDGRGFTSEALHRAFDRFWRDDDLRMTPGSGLGLGIARTIVERYGGSLAIANGMAGGAIVSLRLPRATSEPGPTLPPPLREA